MSNTPFELMKEMCESAQILGNFDPLQVTPWITELEKKPHILLTGEGSSRIFPAHNLITQSLQRGCPWSFHTEGARQAKHYNLNDYSVIGASNSGRTRELIDLFIDLKEKQIPRFALTATPDSKITELADQSIILSCGKEEATAASKSVIEQALVYQSLLQGNEWKNKNQAADLFNTLLSTKLTQEMLDILSSASCLYFSGRNDGVAEELTLKTYEIVRKRSDYLEGTYMFHGIEEVMNASDVLVLIEPFLADSEKIQSVIAKGVGMKIIAIASYDTPFPTLRVPQLAGFDSYFQLLAGWNLLVSTGLETKVDMDKTRRARKLGNGI
jgi:glucosamine--fructose-6-phosphate aminotransferase (isomerizing)